MIGDGARPNCDVETARTYVTKVLRRLKGDDLWRALAWSGVDCESWRHELSHLKTKRALLDALVSDKIGRRGLTFEQLAILDMWHLHNKPNRLWNAYELEVTAEDEQRLFLDSPEVLSKTMNEALDNYYVQHTYVTQVKGCVWMRICTFTDEAAARGYEYTDLAYVACFARCRYMFTSSLKAALSPFVTHAVGMSSGTTVQTVSERALSAKNLDALMDLTIHRPGFGVLAAYKNQNADDHPLRSTEPKRKRDDGEEYDEDEEDERDTDGADRMAMDHSGSRQHFQQAAQQQFGPGQQQPQLPMLEVNLKLPLAGSPELMEMMGEEPMSLKVKIRGTNIFEGLRDLVSQGIAEAPLPAFMGDVAGFKGNSLTISGAVDNLDIVTNEGSAFKSLPILDMEAEGEDEDEDED